MLERLSTAAPGASAAPASPFVALSDKELEVLQLIGRGLKTGEIARSLHRSVHTVEAHLSVEPDAGGISGTAVTGGSLRRRLMSRLS